jgi:phosphoglycolate phosphatase
MTARPTVLLFDVDGTLVTTGGAGRRAMEHAFEVFAGRRDATEGLSFGGMTDRGIARYGLERIGRVADDATIDAFLAAYLGVLGAEIAAAENYRALPGVPELVAALPAHGHLALGLGTGNVEAGARAKLARVELSGAFAFGGFGDDHEDRALLLRAGAERGAALLGHALDACRVVVIGDTPRDVAAATAIGAECLAVATGGASAERLHAAGPARLVHDLSDPSVLGFLAG